MITKHKSQGLILSFLLALISQGLLSQNRIDEGTYLDSLKHCLELRWPRNRTINIVFHGHSVPAGYFATPLVNTLQSYPHLSLVRIKEAYPFAVVNAITTAIGGENSEQGASRFKEEVLCHRPDVVVIDYALNDRSIGLEKSGNAWKYMIEVAKESGARVILMTPTPDLNEDIFLPNSPLAMHSVQVRKLAQEYEVGLADSYALFREIAKEESLDKYMAQSNHINTLGHERVAELIFRYFKPGN